MKQGIRSIFPKEFFKHPAYFRALTLASVYLGVALLQLFTFEKFAVITGGYDLPGGRVTAIALSWLLPLVAVAAFPYLLSMRLGDVSRCIAKAAVLATPILWLILGFWITLYQGADKTNTGLFGATIPTMAGLWLPAFAALWLWSAVLTMKELPRRTK